MTFVNSHRVRFEKDAAEKFVVLVDGRAVATCDTREEAERVAAAEGSALEGF